MANADPTYNTSQAGVSLVGVMIAVAIVGVLANVIAGSFKQNLSTTQKINERAAEEELRQYIRIGMDCAQTTAAVTSCSGNAAVALKRSKAGAPDLVVKSLKTYTKVGKYNLKAYCVSDKKTFNVDYSPTQTNWQKLFTIPIVCP